MSNVSLVWATPDAEKMIVKMARVSNPANEDNQETAPKLLRYLIKHKHISPFEMANMCLKIETERDIAAQILRHRSFSFQEFSTRYAVTGGAEPPSLRRQDTKNRQNSFDDLAPIQQEYWGRIIGEYLEEGYDIYERMLGDTIAKETARRILPLCTPTTLYMNGTLRSWITYIALREKSDTQLEHRQIALSAKQVFSEQFPVVAEALGGSSDWSI